MQISLKHVLALLTVVALGVTFLQWLAQPHLDDPFLDAVMHGRLKEVQRYVQNGNDIHVCDNFGYSALTIAAASGQIRTAQYLIQQGLELNHQSSSGMTPLHAACYRGQLATCQMLLAAGADPNILDENGMSPLSIAALKHEDAICSILIVAGSDVENVDSFGCSPIHAALYGTAQDRGQCHKTVEALLKGGADSMRRTTAPAKQHCRSAYYYSELSASVRLHQTPMQIARDRKQGDVLELLVEYSGQ